MKLIVKIAIGIVIGGFVLGAITMCTGACTACTGALIADEVLDNPEDEDDESYYDEYEDDESEEYSSDSEDDSDDDSEGYSDNSSSNSNDSFYDNAVDDDKKSSTSVPGWGDGTVREISSSQFYSLVAKKNDKGNYIGRGPCVVDFWASWCVYCKQISPYMTRLAKKYKGRVQFYKVNADNCSDVTSLYGIEGLPTVFFCSGSDIEMTSGAFSESDYDKKIKALI